EAIEWFDIGAVGKSPARFDMAKLQNLNAHYLKMKDDQALFDCILPFLENEGVPIPAQRDNILRGMRNLKERSRTLVDLAESSRIYLAAPNYFEEACARYATKEHLVLLQDFAELVENTGSLNENLLLETTKTLATEKGVKLIEIAQAVRGALCGRLASPSVFEIIEIIGKKETLSRIQNFIDKHSPLNNV
ncbi:MAG: hypothetical protein LBL32_02650, partial [Holosporales bacterium]|nr:hypothetical protein [Holosporales bacterium]